MNLTPCGASTLVLGASHCARLRRAATEQLCSPRLCKHRLAFSLHYTPLRAHCLSSGTSCLLRLRATLAEQFRTARLCKHRLARASLSAPTHALRAAAQGRKSFLLRQKRKIPSVLNHAKGVYIINAKRCISPTRSVVYHQAAGKIHAGA